MIHVYILLSVVAVQLFYILVNWYHFRRREYFYYTLYIISITLYFLNRYLSDTEGMLNFSDFSFSNQVADRALALLSYLMYFKFGRNFIEGKTRYPGMYRMMRWSETILFGFILLDLSLVAIFGITVAGSIIFTVVNIGIFIILIIVFHTMIRKNETLDKFILFGSMFYAVSALVTLWAGFKTPPGYADHLIYLQFGALVEMLFLNTGLVYKSRMIQIRLGVIRQRISRDLHDDVGASLSSIKAYAEILENNPKTPNIASFIKDNSIEMIERLEVIAWSTNPGFDNFKSLKTMMQKFASPLLHSHNINFAIVYDGVADDLEMHSETRQYLFMIFKESVNNVIKYADASNCRTILYHGAFSFEMKIEDDGSGFNGVDSGTGNGLFNMRNRARELGGTISINSTTGKGTIISVKIPFPFTLVNYTQKRHD